MTTNEQLQDLYLTRALVIERLKGSFSNKLEVIYKDLFDEIERKFLNKTITIGKLNKFIVDINKSLNIDYSSIGNDLISLAQNESKWLDNAINSSAGIDITSGVLAAKTVEKIANTSLIQGAELGKWFQSLDYSLKFDFERMIRTAVTSGEDTYTIVNKTKDLFDISKRNANSIVLTAISTVTNSVREQVYKENEDIFKGYVFVATLDSRTSPICRTYDGLQWDINHKPIGHKYPYLVPGASTHFRCRSVILPIIKSWKELGIDLEQAPKGTRASMDGQVAQDLTFEDWLKTKSKATIVQVLGKTRAELFMSGKINMQDMLNYKGEYLTITELNKKLD